MLRRTLTILALALLPSLVTTVASGGANEKGKAWLSWDPAGTLSQIGLPTSPRFPLYLHLSDASDIGSLAVDLRWSTGDSLGCYTIVSSVGDAGCGWASDTPPLGDFEGDNTYTWSIAFATKDSKSCVMYTVSSAACGSPSPANFWLASVLAKDSEGNVDALEVLKSAQVISTTPPDKASPQATTYHPNRAIVQFKPGVVTLPSGTTSASIASAFVPEAVRSALLSVGATSLRMLTPTATVENLVATDPEGRTIQLDLRQLDFYVVDLADTNVMGATESLGADEANVVGAQPDWLWKIMLSPNDGALYAKQWWLKNTGQYAGTPGEDLHAEAAWDSTTGGSIDVVVIDTGSDPSHPDLAGRVINGPNYVGPGPPLDDEPEASHGTSCSGMIAAQGNNGIGVAGVNWSARIVAVKAGTAGGYLATSDIDAALDWSRVNGYKLVNMSFGAPDPCSHCGGIPSCVRSCLSADHIAFKNAFMSGMAVFAAIGNDNDATLEYPAAYSPLTIAVGAFMNDGLRWDDNTIDWSIVNETGPPQGIYGGSNTGPHLSFLAPGGRFIETTRAVAFGSYWDIENSALHGFGGTSAAAPAAAGVASLVQYLSPVLTGEDLAQVLAHSAEDIPGPLPNYLPGFDSWSGWGKIDADSAIKFVTGSNRVEHGFTANVTEVAQESGLTRTIQDWGSIPSGQYQAIKHTMRGTVTFSTPYLVTPTVWTRRVSSYGAGNENPIYGTKWVPNTWVASVSGNQATLETYVYRFIPIGGGSQYWWPTDPASVYFACTAVGPAYSGPPVVGVGEEAATFRMLAQPNPSREDIGVKLRLPFKTQGSLAVYDLSGRLVRKLANGTFDAGDHVYRWNLKDADGKPVKSGVYFARLTSPLVARTVRLAVIR